MSAFYDMASLVLVPSGYKASKVYAQKPLTTDGQLSFTRSTGASRVASNGLIEKVRTNLILQSETFDNASWLKTRTSVTANATTAPDGTSTADKIQDADTTSGDHLTFQTPTTSGVIYTFSGYFKKSEYNFVTLHAFGLTGGTFNLNTGVVVSSVGGVSSIVAEANGWYRCSFAFTAGGTSVFISQSPAGNKNYTGTTGSGIFVWGAQLETGDIATQYIATTSAAVSVGPVANVPRLDYLGSTCGKLLLEPQRTNLITYSEQFDNAAWFKGNTTVTANNAISPSGYQDADKIDFAAIANANIQRTAATATTIGTQYTISFYARADVATNNVKLSSAGGDTDLAITTTWERFTRTVTATTTTTSSTLVTRNGVTATIYLWGFQFEAGPYATSYIPTLGAAVTRGADAASKTGISSLIGQTEGVLFVDFVAEQPSEVRRMTLSDGTSANRILIGHQADGTIQFFIAVGSASQVSFNTSASYTKGTRLKIAFAYKANDFAAYINGAQVLTDNSGTVPASSKFAFADAIDTNPLISSVNQTLLFKTRLTNAQLAELTTL